MKYLSLLIIVLISACNMEEAPKEFSKDILAPEKITVGFYNVENLFDTKDDPNVNDQDFTPDGDKEWSEKRYYEKLDKISRVINAMNKSEWPFLVGLAEVENKKVLEDLTDENDLIDANYEIVHYDSPDDRGIDVALLYRKDYFHVLKKESIDVSNPDFPNSKSRDILYVKGEFFNGEIFHIFVNHWSSRRDGTLETESKRMFQASVLKKHVDKINEAGSDEKIIIMGDFNDYPTDKSIKQILGADVNNIGLYNLAYALHMDDKGTINYKNDWGMFDQFMVSQAVFKNGIHLETKQQKILFNDWLVWKGKKPNRTYGGNEYYGGFSDHLPTYIDLVLAK